MPFRIIRDDITHVRADAIVNTANPRPRVGGGTDAAVHAAAGPELLQARRAIGDIRPGAAAVTPAFGLQAQYVIHTVGPVWRGGLFGEERILRRCYDAALDLAWERGCQCVAFPLIAAGTYGFPKDRALQTALDAFRAFLKDHEMEIILVVFDRDAFQLSEKRFREVASYVDEHYVTAAHKREHAMPDRVQRRRREDAQYEVWETVRAAPNGLPCQAPSHAPCAMAPSAAPAAKPLSLAELLEKTDAGFSETLLKLISQSGKKDSEVYTRANVSRQHFSKIRNDPDYKPKKPTAIAFAIALELDLDQTRDLIGRAGYALTRSSKFDLIILYFLEQGNYDLYEINAALYQFDQSLLGA